MKSLFIDVETIGQSVFKAPLLNWSYVIVDWDKFLSNEPYTFVSLLTMIQTDKFDLQSQMDHCEYSKKDLQFWLDQPEGLDVLKRTTSDISTSDGVRNLLSYVQSNGKINNWWTRANVFDPLFIQREAERSSISMDYVNKIIPYWLVRDTRTYIDTRFNFKNKNNGICPFDDEAEWNRVFKKHNSAHDIAADILRLQKIERLINL